MKPNDRLLQLIHEELEIFRKLDHSHNIVPGSIPIIWFGNVHRYFESECRIITVSLNPSDLEFKVDKNAEPAVSLRFPDYDGSVESLFVAFNNYFSTNRSYDSWFKASFGAALQSFDASFYGNSKNVALHTDIGCSYATNPTWRSLSKDVRDRLEAIGSRSWHKLVGILEPNVILFSASRNYEQKIKFEQSEDWISMNGDAKAPLLRGKFKISEEKESVVLFQVQGRRPFLRSGRSEKMNFKNYI